MFRPLLLVTAVTALLTSCNTLVPAWNENGDSVVDLRTMRVRGPHQIALTKDLTLYADKIEYSDKSHRSGRASGRVFLEAGPESPYGVLFQYGYAGSATFDEREHVVVLRDHPMLEWPHMTQVATEPYTTILVHWTMLTCDVRVDGPTRTDFAKSYPVKAGVAVGPLEPLR